MRRLVRRPLTVVALLLVAVGLVLLLPRVLAFYSAAVTNGTSGTYYPTTAVASPDAPFIKCWQDPPQNSVQNPGLSTGNHFKCTNNWASAVTINWSTVTGTGKGTATGITVTGATLSIPAGAQNQCVRTTIASFGPMAGTVRIVGTINQPDLNALIEVGAYFGVGGSNPSPCS